MDELQLYISTWLNLEYNIKWRKDITEGCIQYDTIYEKSENMPSNSGLLCCNGVKMHENDNQI